jgi:Tfp pilus assembly protein FimT
MKNGWTLIDLLILMVFILTLFSVIFPVSKRWIDKVLVFTEVRSVSESLRYAKMPSYTGNNNVEVQLSKSVKIISGKNSYEKEKLSLINFDGIKTVAFAKGVPYISGTVKIYFRGTRVATLTVLPITGLINVEWGW